MKIKIRNYLFSRTTAAGIKEFIYLFVLHLGHRRPIYVLMEPAETHTGKGGSHPQE